MQVFAWRRGASGWDSPKGMAPAQVSWGGHFLGRLASARSGQRQRALASLFIFISVLRYASLPEFDALRMCEWRCRMQSQCLPLSARALGG